MRRENGAGGRGERREERNGRKDFVPEGMGYAGKARRNAIALPGIFVLQFSKVSLLPLLSFILRIGGLMRYSDRPTLPVHASNAFPMCIHVYMTGRHPYRCSR